MTKAASALTIRPGRAPGIHPFATSTFGRAHMALLFVGLLCAASAHAAITTLSQTRRLDIYGSGPYATPWSCGCTSFDRFDPALGTLLRVDYADSGQFTGHGAGDVQYSFIFQQRMIFDEAAPPSAWPLVSSYVQLAAPHWDILFSTSGTVAEAFEPYFIGTGSFRMAQTAQFRINGFSANFNGLSSFLTLTYVYDDTPAPASVPGPATLWLLVGGLAGLSLLRRRRSGATGQTERQV